MVSTPTTRLRLERQGLGENLNVWGETKLNDALSRIDEAIAGVQSITISGTSTTLTSTNYATDQARNAALVLTGTLSGASTIIVPGVEKLYLVVNNTTQGAFSLTVRTAAGAGYALRPGPQHVYCDATNVFRATPRLDQIPLPSASLNLAGFNVTGMGPPVVSTDATTKAYVDAGDGLTLVAPLSNTLDPTLGRYFTRTISGGGTFVFGAPGTTVYEFTLEVTHTSGEITWPASVTWPSGTAPTLTTGKTHLFRFITRDGGTKWRGRAWVDYTT